MFPVVHGALQLIFVASVSVLPGNKNLVAHPFIFPPEYNKFWWSQWIIWIVRHEPGFFF
jgi:hypothetical protein